jgi:methyl-accepting chemotaxis protein
MVRYCYNRTLDNQINQRARVIEESTQAAAQMVAGDRQQAAGVEQVAVAMQSMLPKT